MSSTGIQGTQIGDREAQSGTTNELESDAIRKKNVQPQEQ